MSKKWIVFLLLLSLCGFSERGFAQQIYDDSIDLENSSKIFVQKVKTAQDSLYDQVINVYDTFLENQKSVYVQIEKCQFIDEVFFNEDEYYNSKYLDFEDCLERLISDYAGQLDALIYYHYHQYQDSSIIILENIVSEIDSAGTSSNVKYLWLALKDLANHYSYQENPDKSLYLAKDAMAENDTLDLSALIAKQYIELGRWEEAKEILIENLDSVRTNNLYSKGEMFLEQKDHENALKVFMWLDNSDEGWEVSEELGKIFTALERYDEARPYLVKASNANWNKRKSLETLFLFDLKYSPSDTLTKTYSLMRDQGFLADPFGIFKFKMITQRGIINLQFRDALIFFSYLILWAGILILPYLWILPIYTYGKWKEGKTAVKVAADTRWSLKHFWYISSLFLFAAFATEIILHYPDFIASLNDEFTIEGSRDSFTMANTLLLYDLILVIGTFVLLRLKDLKSVIGDTENWKKELYLGIGFLFVVRFIYAIVTLIIGDFSETSGSLLSSSTYLDEAILGMVEHYGSFIAFLSVVIVAPIIEEIQFRGIILGSTSKYLPFWAANILQSVLFVLIHENLSFFVFYFTFALVAGYLRKKTGGYLAPLVLHIVNNFIAFLWIIA